MATEVVMESRNCSLYNNTTLFDITVKFNGRQVYAHKAILAQMSAYIMTAFTSLFSVATSEEVDLGDDADSGAVHAMMRYILVFCLNVFIVADKYDVAGLGQTVVPDFRVLLQRTWRSEEFIGCVKKLYGPDAIHLADPSLQTAVADYFVNNISKINHHKSLMEMIEGDKSFTGRILAGLLKPASGSTRYFRVCHKPNRSNRTSPDCTGIREGDTSYLVAMNSRCVHCGSDAGESYRMSGGSLAESKLLPFVKMATSGSASSGDTSLFDNKFLSDVTLKFGGQQLSCHKVVLVRKSKYFFRAFSSQLSVASSDEVDLGDDEDAEAVRAMIRHIYDLPYDKMLQENTVDDSAAYSTNEDLLFHINVYAVADKYDVPSLRPIIVKKFEDLMEMTWEIDDFVASIQKLTGPSMGHVADASLQAAAAAFCAKHLHKLVKQDNFVEMIQDEGPFVGRLLVGYLKGPKKETMLMKCRSCSHKSLTVFDSSCAFCGVQARNRTLEPLGRLQPVEPEEE
ncbi:hypothetical protein KCU98_g10599, partial [Aureobasidium melanogenum]